MRRCKESASQRVSESASRRCRDTELPRSAKETSSMPGNSLSRGQGLAFDVARSAQAGADARQVGVVVAGMGDQFPCAGRNLLEQGTQGAASRMPVPATAMVPSVVANPSSAMIRRQAGSSQRSSAVTSRETQPGSADCGAQGPLRLERDAAPRECRTRARRAAQDEARRETCACACGCRCASGARRCCCKKLDLRAWLRPRSPRRGCGP